MEVNRIIGSRECGKEIVLKSVQFLERQKNGLKMLDFRIF